MVIVVVTLFAVLLGLEWWSRSALREADQLVSGRLPTARDAAAAVLGAAPDPAFTLRDATSSRLDAVRGEVRLRGTQAERRSFAGVAEAVLIAQQAVFATGPWRAVIVASRLAARGGARVALVAGVLSLGGVAVPPWIMPVAIAAALVATAAFAIATQPARSAAQQVLAEADVPASLQPDLRRVLWLAALAELARLALPADPPSRRPASWPGAGPAAFDSTHGGYGYGGGHGGGGHSGHGGGFDGGGGDGGGGGAW